ncbi:putative protein S-acyltransferase [Rosa chinensis]|uniref:Uncharacterized protein n=1 Tax=Rosa chinensis TaxID=74649 RepID=A0A2P6QGQ9_ROSCH|nr:putative protein S-acyltransferase [Rosa chinensis]
MQDGVRNKQDFFIFICMGTLASSISAAVTVQRIWTAMPTWQTEEISIHHVIVQYPILVAFLCIDIIIMISTMTQWHKHLRYQTILYVLWLKLTTAIFLHLGQTNKY